MKLRSKISEKLSFEAELFDLDYHAMKSLLSESKKIVITGHKSPDGDAIGSTLGLAAILKEMGHSTTVIVPDAFPKFLAWMNGAETILLFNDAKTEALAAIDQADIIFSLDYNNLERVGDMGQFISDSHAVKVLIDHHLFPSESFDHSLSKTSASSTAELVYDFVHAIEEGSRISTSIAECLYAGIMTDTGSFRFSSTSAHTHSVVADLMNVGLEPAFVHQQVFDSNSVSKLRLVGFALSQKLELLNGNKCAIIPLSLAEKNRFSYAKGDTEGLVNYGLSIEGVEVAVFLSEELNFVKFSFRSKGLINVNEIARAHFNGGGHRNAAGGKLDCNLSEAVEKLKSVLVEI